MKRRKQKSQGKNEGREKKKGKRQRKSIREDECMKEQMLMEGNVMSGRSRDWGARVVRGVQRWSARSKRDPRGLGQ